MEKFIKKLLMASNAVAIIEKNEIIDLSEYIEVYSDGQWSNCGVTYYWSPSKKSLVVYDWTNWQGQESLYRLESLRSFCSMGENLDADHFQRWLAGIKIIFGTDSPENI